MVVGVTGGTGFIGRHLVRRLIDRGETVRILTRRPEAIRHVWPTGSVELWAGDVTNPDTLRGFATDAAVVYHLGGKVRDSSGFRAVNVGGTENLLAACRDEGLRRFVHLSSVGVMGARGEGVVDESSPCHPKNEYERSKYDGERAALEVFERSQTPVTIVRPTIVFGEEPNRDRDSLAAWLVAIQRGWFRFVGRGGSVANYLYVGDLVHACLLVADSDRATGEVYIVSDSCPLREFVGAAAGYLGVRMPGNLPAWLAYAAAIGLEGASRLTHFSPPLTVSRIRALTNRVVYSSGKARTELGFRPEVGWREGLRRTLEWYRENGLLPPLEHQYRLKDKGQRTKVEGSKLKDK